MTVLDQPVPFVPETRILELGGAFYDPVVAADFPDARIRFRNDRAAAEVGLAGLDDAAWVRHFARFEPLPGSLMQPLALRYHGHQFRVYNPNIGDGRGFLFAQCRDDRGRLMDFGTKGSGQTPYSRFGDGRLTLKGGVREILATEMLEALGVETSRSFSLVETGERLSRHDEPSPTRSAVLVRLNHGHVRYGSFQRLAALDRADDMRRLTDYSLRHLLGDQPGGGDDAGARLLDHAVRGGARLAASYMAAGFVHGVLNTDNISITAESFDYGPWRFAPTWDKHFTAAYFDEQGLYAFGRQAEALHWNVWQLALALRTTTPIEALAPVLESFPEAYETAFRDAMFARLGIASRGDAEDMSLLQLLEQAIGHGDVPLDRFWFDWRGGRRRGSSPLDEVYTGDAFTRFAEAVTAFTPVADLSHSYWSDAGPCAMLIDEVEALWAPIAEHDDWAPLEAKIAAIRRMGAAMRSG